MGILCVNTNKKGNIDSFSRIVDQINLICTLPKKSKKKSMLRREPINIRAKVEEAAEEHIEQIEAAVEEEKPKKKVDIKSIAKGIYSMIPKKGYRKISAAYQEVSAMVSLEDNHLIKSKANMMDWYGMIPKPYHPARIDYLKLLA
ncbi:hypothetical protein ACFLZX_06120 [Nanoarchaeota archaeon]